MASQLMGTDYKMGEVMDIISIEIEAMEQGATNLIPVIIGDPGIGKSASLKHKAEQLNMDSYIISLGALPMEWFSGLPEFGTIETRSEYTHDGRSEVKVTEWTMSDLVRSINTKTEIALANGKRGLMVLLDDLHLVEPVVQKYLFEFFQNKTLQNYRLNEKAFLVGAMNGKDSAGLEGFLSAVLDRMAMYFVKFDQEFWYHHVGYSLHPYVASFAQQSSNYRYFLGANEVDSSSPSPRSWTELSSMIGVIEKFSNSTEDLNKKIAIAAESRVGREAAVEFIKHVKLFQKFDFENLLNKQEPNYRVSEDITDQILMAFVIRYIRNEKDAKYLIHEILNNNLDRRTFISLFIQEYSTIFQNIHNMPDGEGKKAFQKLADILTDENEVGSDLTDIVIEGMMDMDS